MRAAIAGMVMICTAGLASGEPAAAPRSFDIGGSSVALPWSAGWAVDASVKDPKSLEFTATDAHAMRTVISKAPPNAPVHNDTQLQFLVKYMADELAPQSVEKKLEIKPVGNSSGPGYYVCATDPKPKPDEYKYICQGALLLDDGVLTFTLLYNEPGIPESKQVLGALAALEVGKGA
jgi:hypothetical protein